MKTKTFFLYLLILFVLVGLTDRFAGLVLNTYYTDAKYGYTRKTNYIVTETDEKILIFGSSRASHHYVPTIFKDSLGATTYNCGMDGQGISFHYAVLLRTLERYTPELVILDLTPGDYFFFTNFGSSSLNALAPFYGVNPEFDKVLDEVNPAEKIKMQSMMYRYNSSLIEILVDNLLDRNADWIDGYMPLFQVKSREVAQRSNERIDPSRFRYLQRFVDLVQENHINLVVCISPSRSIVSDSLFLPVENLLFEAGVPLLNHYSDSAFILEPELFQDYNHLNDKGAKLYSRQIAHEILSKSYR